LLPGAVVAVAPEMDHLANPTTIILAQQALHRAEPVNPKAAMVEVVVVAVVVKTAAQVD
jgi:hypothetical protein